MGAGLWSDRILWYLAGLMTLMVALVGASSATAEEVGPREVSEFRKDYNVSANRAEEVLETQAKGTEADISAQLEERLDSNYAGIWYDNERAEFVVPLAPGASGAAVASEFDQADLRANEVRSVRVRWSWEELEAAQAEIDEALARLFDAPLVQTALDPRANAVVIRHAAGADVEQRAEIRRLADAAKVEVKVEEIATKRFGGELEACSGAFCGRPLRGGVKVFNQFNEGEKCTAAFRAIGTGTGNRYLLTAGHCVELPGFSLNLNWASRDEANVLRPIGAAEQWQYKGNDWAKINANGSYWDVAPWPAEVAAWGVNEDYPITGATSNVVGAYVCRSGIITGTSCGTITNVGVSHEMAGLYWVHDLVEIWGIKSQPGDSGAPYWVGSKALGIHVGSDSNVPGGPAYFYTDISKATQALGVYLPTQPTVTTGDAPTVEDRQALVTGTVNPNGYPTSFRFEYGMTTAYGKSIPVPSESAGSENSPVVVSKMITDLEARSHYHYRLVATNAAGTVYGADRTFTTGVKWLVRNSNSAGGADGQAWLGLPGNLHVSGDWNGDGVETPGSYDPSTGEWQLSNSLSRSGNIDIAFQFGGAPWTKAVAGDWNGDGTDTIGVYDPVAGNWNMRDSNSAGGANHAFQFGGAAWETPVVGDWDGDGDTTIGVYDREAGNWNLRDSNSAGGADHAFQFGGAPWTKAVAGDWNGDGTDTIGVYDPVAGNWNLRDSNSAGGADIAFQYGGSQFGTVVGDWDGNGTTTVALTDADATVERNWLLRNSNSSGEIDLAYLFGFPGQVGVVGDWNGDGFQTLGSYEPVSGTWRLSNSNSNQKPDIEFQFGGGPWTAPVVGDWNNDGTTTIGVYDPVAGNWNLRDSNSNGAPDMAFQYGGGAWKNAVAGDWDGNGTTTIGVYDPDAGNWNLRNSNGSGGADIAFQYGGGLWKESVVGDWNNDGIDTIGVFEPQAGNWNLRNSNSAGGADIAFQYGGSQFQPIAGDWDGDGTVTVGLIANNGELTTPASPPDATTQPATGISEGQATLNGTVNPGGFSTRYRFEWGTTTAYGISVPVPYGDAGLGTANVGVSKAINGLLGDTTYHYRLVAESAEGKRLGEDATFKTPPQDNTPEKLAGLPVAESFNGSAISQANFSSNWGKLGWAADKGEDATTGWRSTAASPTAQGAFSNVIVSDAKGAATVATMAANPGGTERSFSLWLDMASPSGASRSGYEFRFSYVSSNTYSVTLSKWSSGSQTVLASKTGVTFANGSSLSLVDKGSSVSGWIDTGAGFTQLLSASDSTFASGNAGLQAVGNLTRLTKFKVGSVLPNTTADPGTSTYWNLRNSNKTGNPDVSYQFGVAGKQEVVGDWNGDGVTTVGTYDSSSGVWKLRNAPGPGPAEIILTFGGGSFTIPIVGDWNGDKIDTVGVFDPNVGNWSLRNSNFAGTADNAFQYGGASSKPIVGNWDGIGADGIGVYYPSSGNWNLRECVCGGNPTYSFQFGGGPWSKPIAGNWDGIGADGIGVFDPSAGNWNLRHCMCGGNPDYSFQYGGGAWATPIVGRWNGTATDTIGVAND